MIYYSAVFLPAIVRTTEAAKIVSKEVSRLLLEDLGDAKVIIFYRRFVNSES